MQYDIKTLFKTGFLSNLDYYFADTLSKISSESNHIVKLSAALTSKASRDGHVCLDITQLADKSISLSDTFLDTNPASNPDSQTKFSFPAKDQWIKALKASKLVGKDIKSPLVLDSDNKLYLARYFDYQQRLVKNILQRIKNALPEIPALTLEKELNTSFLLSDQMSREEQQGCLIQKNTLKEILTNNFFIITGGPGTGKTYITDKIESIFKNLSKKEIPIKVINTAPTGKAASKLKNGITIHRLLKIKPNSQISRKKRKVPIIADLVIIDEASMIDISLMTKLLESIPLKSKVVIIGDQNQLGSIETGSVFADICRSKKLKNFISRLDYNFRSGGKKEIDKLARAINFGDQSLIEDILINAQSKKEQDLSFININNSNDLSSELENIIDKGYSPYFKENDITLAHEKLKRFKILCAHRKHFSGTNNLNLITEKLLQEHPIHDIKAFSTKSILMINKNDYNKLLFNGDIGMVIEENHIKKVVFMNEDESQRSFNLSDLNNFEPAFAITVHKSQGSEFDHILLILPPVSTNLLTKELLYTAITRARKKVTIAGTIDVIKKAVESHSKKESGITKMLDKNICLNNE